MAEHCYPTALGRVLRATELNACGAPAYGGNVAVTDGFISISLTSNVADPTEISVTRADGSICASTSTNPSFTNFGVEIEFCQVDPGLFALLTNGRVVENYLEENAGVAFGSGPITTSVALEFWTNFLQQASCDDQGGEQVPSVYWLLPFVRGGVLGDISVDGENAITFMLTGMVTLDNNNWGSGPYNVVYDDSQSPAVPAPLAQPLEPTDHLMFIDTTYPPPPAKCGVSMLQAPLTGTISVVPAVEADEEAEPPVEAAPAYIQVNYAPTTATGSLVVTTTDGAGNSKNVTTVNIPSTVSGSTAGSAAVNYDPTSLCGYTISVRYVPSGTTPAGDISQIAPLTSPALTALSLSLSTNSVNVPTTGTNTVTISSTKTPTTSADTIVYSIPTTTGVTLSGNTISVATTAVAGTVTVTGKGTACSSVVNTSVLTINAASSSEAEIEPTAVTVTPADPSVAKGATEQFTAVVDPSTASQDVVWSITGESASDTEISSTGLLTVGADETATTLTVIASTVATPVVSGDTTVTVTTA